MSSTHSQVESLLRKIEMDSEELEISAQGFTDTYGRQIETQTLYVPQTSMPESSNARKQFASPMALRTLQEKVDQNSRETSAKVSNILKKIEEVHQELAVTRSDYRTIKGLHLRQIDNVRDAMDELDKDVNALTRGLRITEHDTSSLAYELSVVKEDLKKVNKDFEYFPEKEDLGDEILENDITEVSEEISEVRDNVSEVSKRLKDLKKRVDEIVENEISKVRHEMREIRDTMTASEKRENKQLIDVKPAIKSLKGELIDVTNELERVKDVAASLEKTVMSELKNVKEELQVVKEKTRAANLVQDNMLLELRKVKDEVSSVKHDHLREIGVEVRDELGMGVDGRMQDVRRKLKSIWREMRAVKDEQIELVDADLELIREFNDAVRSVQKSGGQNAVKLINKKKRKQDSRHHPGSSKQNKRLRKQSSSRGGELGTAPDSSASSDSDSS